LRRADLLAALGKLVPLENSDLVSELLDDRFIAMGESKLTRAPGWNCIIDL
jgi:hypothetical protein